ncbi:MAG: NAD-binding protein [Acidobacteria bacterium]|nr:NAD-binding protein [Acidobacteriota bacterium]
MIRLLWLLFARRGKPVPRVGVKVKAFLLFALLLWYASAGFLFFELPNKPDLGWLDSLWWALVTMATVGYGDLFPVTPAGRYLVGVPTMVFGIGFLGYLISEIAGSLIETRSRRLKGMLDITLTKHILLVNHPRLDVVVRLVEELRSDSATRDQAICLVDESLPELPTELESAGLLFVKGDPTREETLKKANAAGASHAILLAKDPADPHSDDRNLVTTLVLERLNPGLFTVVEVLSAGKIRQVELAGADSVVCAAELASGLIVQELQDPGVKAIIADLCSDTAGHQLYFIPVEGAEGRRYADLVQWGVNHQCAVLGYRRGGETRLACSAEEGLAPGDRAVLVAADRPASLRLG